MACISRWLVLSLVAGLEEEVEDLHEHHTAEGSYHEGERSEDEDVYRLHLQELVGLGGASYGQTDEDSHDVDQRSACGLGQTTGNTALLEEVAEEEHTQQGDTRGHDECGYEEADDREELLLCR